VEVRRKANFERLFFFAAPLGLRYRPLRSRLRRREERERERAFLGLKLAQPSSAPVILVVLLDASRQALTDSVAEGLSLQRSCEL